MRTHVCLAVGPRPTLSIATLMDLGLSRSEIARYLRTDETTLESLDSACAGHHQRLNPFQFDSAQGHPPPSL